jgi:hypothetical protein
MMGLLNRKSCGEEGRSGDWGKQSESEKNRLLPGSLRGKTKSAAAMR